MIGDKFEYNGKSYTIKKDVSFGEYKRISKTGSMLQTLTKEFEEAGEDRKQQILEQFTKTSDDQLTIISDFIESTLGLTQKDIDKLSLFNAIGLFNEAFTVSTQVKKKSETISESPSP